MCATTVNTISPTSRPPRSVVLDLAATWRLVPCSAGEIVNMNLPQSRVPTASKRFLRCDGVEKVINLGVNGFHCAVCTAMVSTRTSSSTWRLSRVCE